MIDALDPSAAWLGRVARPGIGPCVVTIRDGRLLDITSSTTPLVRDIVELADPVDYIRTVDGEDIGAFDETNGEKPWTLLAPCDLQAVKACGVTFSGSMIERVIEEQAAGDPALATEIRDRIGARIGSTLKDVVPGSNKATEVKQALIEEGLWSQYLEVGIGPDAEVFSKAQVLSSVGHGADVGIHPISEWNNPEPEVVLAVDSLGGIKGATLGNDVNLRDIEGRSALLLSKAKDNNASCAIGPMIRLFDDRFNLNNVRNAVVTLRVTGQDGFELHGESRMDEISRDPEDLVSQTIGLHHQYPDGLMLFLGTLFAPTQDRSASGQGFTHEIGDVVTISSPELGALTNRVRLCTECPQWTFGASHLMRNLAERGLL